MLRRKAVVLHKKNAGDVPTEENVGELGNRREVFGFS
jgi:hypothetical protein